MEPGSWAEWLSAGAATCALIAAGWAAGVSTRLLRLEMKRDEAASDRERRHQQTRLTAWCLGRPGGEGVRQRGLELRNTSDAPFYDVEVESTYASSKSREPTTMPPLKLDLLPPGEFVVLDHETYHWALPVERSTFADPLPPVMKNAGWRVTTITFTDSYGVRWRRQGSLVEALDEGNS